MTTDKRLDETISKWLEAEAPRQMPDRILRMAFKRTRTIKQQSSWHALLRRMQVNRMFAALVGVAAVVVVAIVGLGLFFNNPGVGAPPPPSPTIQPTATPSPTPEPTASPRPMPEGNLRPGTYIAHPLQDAGNPLSVTFTVPGGWAEGGGNIIYVPTDVDIEVGVQLEDITSLNGDPCDWSGTADDIDVGTTVDDLVETLSAQTAYEVSEPVDVTIGGYSGKMVEIIHPADAFTGPDSDGHFVAPGCDDGNYRIWSSAVHGENPIYGQGPDNRWQANILDVEGTRLVVVAMDFPDTAAQFRAEMDAIIDSFVIDPGD